MQSILGKPDPGEGSNNQPDFETKRQLADRLGVSPRTIDNLKLRGLPYLALTGKLRRFPRREVDHWLRQYIISR